jgi:transcriptional regulator with XRE-family HTH domain
MKTAAQGTCLCKFLYKISEEKGLSAAELAIRTGISEHRILAMFRGDETPDLHDLISIGNELDMCLTFQHTVSFAHQKIVRCMEKSQQSSR